MNRHVRTAARIALFAGGVVLVGWLVSSVGYRRVGNALYDAGPSFPFVVTLELAIVMTDVAATRALLGDAGSAVRASTWTRATAFAYAAGIVLPAGRAAGEAARASALAVDIGLPRAAAACSRVQTAALFGTAAASLASSAAALQASATLALLLAGNAVLCSALAVAVLSLARWQSLARWLRARWPTLAAQPSLAIARGATAKASLLCALGRAFQVVQYAVALGAVGGEVSPRAGLVAQGIHLVGATVGDAVPNQVGTTEGAFDMFAGTLGLAQAPARALSIALLIRVAQLGLALVAFVVATLASPRSTGAAARRDV
jgi:hypothetical protein